MPERKAERLDEEQQQRFFDEIIEPRDEEARRESPGEQGSLSDF
jgi:hypothetical protein